MQADGLSTEPWALALHVQEAQYQLIALWSAFMLSVKLFQISAVPADLCVLFVGADAC